MASFASSLCGARPTRNCLRKPNAALAWLKDNGYKPCESFTSRNRSNAPNSEDEVPIKDNGNGNRIGGNNGHPASWCPIHQFEMKRWKKDGKV